MICSKCGNQLNPNLQVCDKCGTPVGQPITQAAPQAPINPATQMVAPEMVSPGGGAPVQQPVVQTQPVMQQPVQTPVAAPAQPVEMLNPMPAPVQQPAMQMASAPAMAQPMQQPVQQMAVQTSVSAVPQPAPTMAPPMPQAPVQAAPVQPQMQENPFASIQPAQPMMTPAQQAMMSGQQAPAGSFQSAAPMPQQINVNGAPMGGKKPSDIPPPNKPALILIGCVAIFALVAICAVLLKPVKNVSLKDDGTRTVMIYLIGSDLESSQGSATFDINEMLESDFDEENVNVLIYAGGSKKWYTSEISNHENAIFAIEDGELVKKKAFDKEIMTKKGPLVDFIDYVYENYETDLYDLILWDHGGGPIYGYGLDEFNMKNTAMSLDTLNDALDDTKLMKETKFDFIGFDACLMGSIEVAYSLKDKANYLIASEELEPGAGWNYSFLGEITPETKTSEVGKIIIDEFFTYYEEGRYKGNLTLSIMDLNDVEILVEEVNALFNKADTAININTYSKYARKLTRETVYGNTGRSASTYDLVDLMDLTNSISDEYPEEAEAVETAIKDVIVYSKDNMSNTNGISIYFPTNNKKNVDKMLTAYNNVKISKDYYNFLKKYSSFITGTRLVDSESYRGINPSISGGAVSVELPDDLAANYEKGDYIIFRKLGENNYMPVFKSSNVTLEGNTLTAQPTKQQLVVDSLNGGEPGWATMYEIKREGGYTYYNIVAILEKYDESLEEPFQLKNANIIYKVKDGEAEGEVIDIQPMSNGETASKTSLDLNTWQKIQFFSASYKLYDNNNNYLPEWESYKDYYINVFNIQDGFKLKFVGLDYDLSSIEIKNMDGTVTANTNYEYYYMFRVADTQGEIHQLNLVKVN